MEKHKQMLDREYEQLLTQFSRELERLQLKHQEELGKRVRSTKIHKNILYPYFTRKFPQITVFIAVLYKFLAEKQHQYRKEIDQRSC